LLEEGRQVFGMLLFAGEYSLQHAVRGRILIAEAGDHLAIALDRDSLGNQIFLEHALERVSLDVFRMAACRQAVSGGVLSKPQTGFSPSINPSSG
jgi:hypothetical protein